MRCYYGVAILASIAITGTMWVVSSSASHGDDKTKTTEKTAKDEKPGARKTLVRAFMRKKLAAAEHILEGLAVENFDLIAQGARELKVMAGAAEFMQFDDQEYIEHADDFRRIVHKLSVAAEEHRLDGATLAYLDITMSCVECHKHVRSGPVQSKK
jgi:hypothetical protein